MLNLLQHHHIACETVSATCDQQGDIIGQVEVDGRGAVLHTAQGSAIDAIAITQGYCSAKKKRIQCDGTAMRRNAVAMRSGNNGTATRSHVIASRSQCAAGQLRLQRDCNAMQWNAVAMRGKTMRGKTMRRSDWNATRCDCDALLKYLQPNGYTMQQQWADTNSSTT